LKHLATVLIFLLATLACLNQAQGEEKPVKEVQVIGEFFDQPVPVQNYFFVKSVLLAFANRWGLEPQSEEELDAYVWDYLLLSYEAFRNNIVASAEEINAEIKQILKENNAGFNRNKDKDAYAKWVKEKTNQNPAVFENQVRFMVEIGKLRQRIIDSFSVGVSDEEAQRLFQDEHNLLSMEVAGFLEEKDAQGFYERVEKNPGFWQEQKKSHPDSFKFYDLTALKSLMSSLGVERAVFYKMLELENQEIQSPLPITQGYGVFKILNKKLAQETDYAKLKYNYFEQLKEEKINQGFQEWLARLRQKAKIKIYRRGG
jgi:hypothetical protein